jgi:hypothetical protein
MHPDSFYPDGSRKKFAIGILFEINSFNYYAPISSIKSHQINVVDPNKLHPDYKQFCFPIRVKRYKVEQVVALIRLDFMFPVSDDNFFPVPFNTLDKEYQIFVRSQYSYCKKNMDDIRAKARIIYSSRIDDLATAHVKEKCCDFKLLESWLQNWIDKSPIIEE